MFASFAAHNSALANSGCSRHSPPEKLQQRFVRPPAASAIIGEILHDFRHDFAGGDVSADDFLLAGNRHLFHFKPLGFRVAAPLTAQHAALEKDDGADARPVVNGEFLYIEDSPFCL